MLLKRYHERYRDSKSQVEKASEPMKPAAIKCAGPYMMAILAPFSWVICTFALIVFRTKAASYYTTIHSMMSRKRQTALQRRRAFLEEAI